MGWDGGEVKANVFIAGALGGLSALRCGCGGARPSHPPFPGAARAPALGCSSTDSSNVLFFASPRSAPQRSAQVDRNVQFILGKQCPVPTSRFSGVAEFPGISPCPPSGNGAAPSTAAPRCGFFPPPRPVVGRHPCALRPYPKLTRVSCVGHFYRIQSPHRRALLNGSRVAILVASSQSRLGSSIRRQKAVFLRSFPASEFGSILSRTSVNCLL